jgi:hypothetical protein
MAPLTGLSVKNPSLKAHTEWHFTTVKQSRPPIHLEIGSPPTIKLMFVPKFEIPFDLLYNIPKLGATGRDVARIKIPAAQVLSLDEVRP